MGWLILIALLLVLAYVLYLGKRSRERRRLEQEREAEKLLAQVDDHHEMAVDHDARAEDLTPDPDQDR